MQRLEARVKRVEDAGKDYLAWQETERRNKQSLVNLTAASEAKPVGNDQNAQPKYEEYSGLTEGAKLRRLLKTGHVRKKLTCLTDVALESTSPVTRRDKYKPLTDTLNDGFEVSLGPVPYAAVSKVKDGLINYIQARSSLITIKNLIPLRRSQETVIWVTLGDACRQLRRGLVGEIIAAVGFLQSSPPSTGSTS